ncbi:hypothetical protein EIP86_005556 [Pleurotus ostreatoroseus]|nr:hypothetical protein EIP86_005556 [Pleurotus ostreatoroseus]
MLATPGDAVCLALTCRLFAVLAHARASEIVSPWARDRVLRVCKKTKIVHQITWQEERMLELSGLLHVDARRRTRRPWMIRWPADVFTDEERRNLLHYRGSAFQTPEPTFYQYFSSFKEVNTIAWASPYPIGYLPEARSSPSSGAGDPDQADTMRYKEWVTRWAESIKRERTTINDKLALRNLSKRQFLRARDLECLLPEMGLQAGSWTYGLEHVALKRMCWKAEQAAAVWAGDRLEIGEMGETDEQQGWVNVYEEVRREYLPPKQSAVRDMIVEVV